MDMATSALCVLSEQLFYRRKLRSDKGHAVLFFFPVILLPWVDAKLLAGVSYSTARCAQMCVLCTLSEADKRLRHHQFHLNKWVGSPVLLMWHWIIIPNRVGICLERWSVCTQSPVKLGERWSLTWWGVNQAEQFTLWCHTLWYRSVW